MVVSRLNTEFSTEVIKIFTFDREISKVAGFMMPYKLYIKIIIRKVSVKKQV